MRCSSRLRIVFAKDSQRPKAHDDLSARGPGHRVDSQLLRDLSARGSASLRHKRRSPRSLKAIKLNRPPAILHRLPITGVRFRRSIAPWPTPRRTQRRPNMVASPTDASVLCTQTVGALLDPGAVERDGVIITSYEAPCMALTSSTYIFRHQSGQSCLLRSFPLILSVYMSYMRRAISTLDA